MSQENIVASIDIGTSKIRTVIAGFEGEGSDFHMLGVGTSQSHAIRKGNILDMEEFKANLDASLEEAEKMSGEPANGVHLSLNSSSFEVIQSKGIIAVSGDEIDQSDIERVLDMAKNGVDMPNREILKIVPEYFVVDFEDGVKNPIGMSARKLEVVANIFSMNKNILDNIKRGVADVGVELYDVYPNLLTSPEGVLTRRQKELGVVCIDIGASTTGVTVYEEGVLKFASVVPVGGDSVTNDIALGVRTSIDVAEKLKTQYGELGLSEETTKEETLLLSDLFPGEEGEVSNLYLSQIISARYEEIFYFVNMELKKIGRDGMLPEGAVMVGGASKIKGLVPFAKNVLRLPVFIGLPMEKQSVVETSMSDPVFAGVVGSLILGNKYSSGKMSFRLNFGGFFESIMKIFKKLIP